MKRTVDRVRREIMDCIGGTCNGISGWETGVCVSGRDGD